MPFAAAAYDAIIFFVVSELNTKKNLCNGNALLPLSDWWERERVRLVCFVVSFWLVGNDYFSYVAHISLTNCAPLSLAYCCSFPAPGDFYTSLLYFVRSFVLLFFFAVMREFCAILRITNLATTPRLVTHSKILTPSRERRVHSLVISLFILF